MNEFEPRVNNVSLFREIAKNIVNPLEIIREAISNSHDAESKEICITIYRNKSNILVIEITDDGNGMDIDGLCRFFNLGDSIKNQIGIGEKGLGTKTYFRSMKISVYTQTKDCKRYYAFMDNPWEKLKNDELPKYYIVEHEPEIGKNGTVIVIEGYIIDNPERFFNFDTLKDYVLWFTAAGSFKTVFASFTELHSYVQNMQIAPKIIIIDNILNQRIEIAGTRKFSSPVEIPHEDNDEQIYKRSVNYCRHFGPFHRATNINGEYVSFQLYGTISGLNCRKQICKLRQGETYKTRFGLYLCKDFIPFTRRHEILSEPNYQHYHLLLNSQNFELTADRNNLSNEDDPKVKWVFDEVKKIIDFDIKPLAENGYFKLRKNEELEDNIKEKENAVIERKKQFVNLEDIVYDNCIILKKPTCETQVAILFASILSQNTSKKNIKGIYKIGNYSDKSPTDMICIDENGNEILVELEFRLSNLFKHNHPYGTFDQVVCWEVDLEINEKKKTTDGSTLKLVKEHGQWILKYGPQKVIPIIELKSILSDLLLDKKSDF